MQLAKSLAHILDFPGSTVVKDLPTNAGDPWASEPKPLLYLQGEWILLLCPFKEFYDFPSEKTIIAASS